MCNNQPWATWVSCDESSSSSLSLTNHLFFLPSASFSFPSNTFFSLIYPLFLPRKPCIYSTSSNTNVHRPPCSTTPYQVDNQPGFFLQQLEKTYKLKLSFYYIRDKERNYHYPLYATNIDLYVYWQIMIVLETEIAISF